MDSFGKWVLAAAAVCVVLAAGCTYKPDVAVDGAEPSAGTHTVTQVTPEPTATPAPTPVPFELAAYASEPKLIGANSAEDVLAAASISRDNSGYEALFAVETDAAAPDDGAKPALKLDPWSGDKNGGKAAASGNTCFAISGSKLIAVRATDDGLESLKAIGIGEQWTSGYSESGEPEGYEDIPLRLFLYGSRLAVVYSHYEARSAAGELRTNEYTGVDVYEVSDPGSPQLLRSMGQRGSFLDAELTDGNLTLLTRQEPEIPEDGSIADDQFPYVISDGTSRQISPEKIFLSETGSDRSFITAAVYSLSESSLKDAVSFFGFDRDVLLKNGSIYVWASRWTEIMPEGNSSDPIRILSECTDLYRITLTGDRFEPDGAVSMNGAIPGPGAVTISENENSVITALRQGYYLQDPDNLTVPEEQGRGFSLVLFDDSMEHSSSRILPVEREQKLTASFRDHVFFSGPATAQVVHIIGTDEEEPVLSVGTAGPVSADLAAAWNSDSYLFFRRSADGITKLSVWGEGRGEFASRTFAGDFISAVDHPESFMILPDKNIIAFPAEDSYCVFRLDGSDSIVLSVDAYSSGPAGGMSAALSDRYLFIAGGDTLVCYDTTDWTEVEDAALIALRKKR